MARSTDDDWARGYAKQVLSDLRAREALVHANAEKCHRLHFLQMAAEKACKAHSLTKGTGNIARHFYAAINDNNQIAQWEISQIKRLAHEIEVLAPACGHGDLREDNSEYPWEDANGEVQVPCEYSFPNIDDGARAVVRLIRLIRTASESYSR